MNLFSSLSHHSGRILLAGLCLLVLLITACSNTNDAVILETTNDTASPDAPTSGGITDNARDISENSDNDVFDQLAQGDIQNADVASDNYVTYETDIVQTLIADDRQVVLFFYSDQDASSVALHRDIRDNNGRIPANTVIVSIDMADHPDVFESYGVQELNMIYFLDANGDKKRQM